MNRGVSNGRQLASRTAAIAAVAVAAVLLTPAPGVAEWPMFRRDPARTAYAPGSSLVHRPAPLWRYYLGGTLGAEQYWAGDLNGDRRNEVVFLSGGRVVVKSPNDTLLMDSPPLDLFRIERVADLDRDGTVEIVASALAGRVYVVGADGAVRWRTPDGAFGNIGAVRFGDFNRDGFDDMYVADQACGSTGSLGDVARVYSFAAGIAAVRELFQLERGRRDYVCGINDTLGDFNGDGQLDILALGWRHLYVYSGVDGRLLATSPNIGSIPYGLATTNVVNVDGDNAQEVVCFTNNSYGPDINSRRVFLMDWDAGTNTLTRRWERGVADVAREMHWFVHSGTHDLDGDGTWEVVTSFWASPHARLHVLDARDGTTRAEVSDARVEGVLDVEGDGRLEILGRSGAGVLTAFEFRGLSLVPRWALAGRRVVSVVDVARRDVQSGIWVPLALDVDGDGWNELLLTSHNAHGEVAELLAYDAELAPPTVAARYVLPTDTVPLTYQPFADITGPGEGLQIAMARNDGYLLVLGRGLTPRNQPGAGEGHEPGLRIGGYYLGRSGFTNALVAADLERDGSVEVVVRNSRGALDCLRLAGATLVTQPALAWSRPGEWAPALIDVDGDGRREVASLIGGTVRLTSPDGRTPVWSRTVTGTNEWLTHDLLPMGDLTGDGRPEFLYHVWVGFTGNARINVLDGRTGAPVWPTSFETLVAGSGWGMSAAFDLTGDGLDDPLICPRNLLTQLRPTNGTQVAAVDARFCGIPLVRDLNRDRHPEIASTGSVGPPRVFTRSLTELWRATGTRQYTRVFGCVAECPGEVRFAQASHNSATLEIWHGSSGAPLASIALAGGASYSTEADARAAGRWLGVLGNCTTKEDLTGTGTTGVLVGSTDGWLYAVDPCTATLIWSYNFRYPVGESVFADVDNDGADDILVSVADGFLYAVSRERFPAPAEVLDTDPPGGFPAEDRDTIDTVDTLYARWTPVVGATSYEYAVITPSGTFLTHPHFVNVGTATTATAVRLGLRLGGTYYFAVRAIGPGGSSAEVISDGIRVVDETPPAIGLRASPNPFSPDGDGVDDTTTVAADLTDYRGLGSWDLVIYHPGGLAVARTFPPRALSGDWAVDSVEWDGRDDTGTILSEGAYPAVATVRDHVGNSTRATIHLEIRFPGRPDVDAGTGADADAGQDGIADADAGTHPDAGPGGVADAGAGADSEADPDVDSDADTGAEADADPDVEPEVDPDVDTDADTGAEADADPDVEPEVDPDGDTDADAAAEADADPDVDAEVDQDADADADVGTHAEADAGADAETYAVPDGYVGPEAGFDGRDVHDDGPAFCDPALCLAACRDSGASGGRCEGSTCLCYEDADGGADVPEGWAEARGCGCRAAHATPAMGWLAGLGLLLLVLKDKWSRTGLRRFVKRLD